MAPTNESKSAAHLPPKLCQLDKEESFTRPLAKALQYSRFNRELPFPMTRIRFGSAGGDLAAPEDFHLRAKIFHFDHERIPERVVPARGFGAHGHFENYESLAAITPADLFQRRKERTPALVRFSTAAGNKGSSDLARDVRGFAVKLYTKQGNWDNCRQ